MKKVINVYFFIHPDIHILDLAGPCQAFYEVDSRVDDEYKLHYVSISDKIRSEQGLEFCSLKHISTVRLAPTDILFVAGIDFKKYIQSGKSKDNLLIGEWIRRQYDCGATVCSICSGTLILADAGILDGKNCTSHWKCLDYVKKTYPKLQVLDNRVFVKDGNVLTSAGMTSGVDLALSLIEEAYGPIITSKVAREMVVYIRRCGDEKQISHYLDYKTHFDPKVHQVQDIICSNLSENYSNQKLASMVNMSERNLMRVFKNACGISIITYKNKMRVELIKHLKHNPKMSIKQIASECGFKNSRQLYRIWDSDERGRLRQSATL